MFYNLATLGRFREMLKWRIINHTNGYVKTTRALIGIGSKRLSLARNHLVQDNLVLMILRNKQETPGHHSRFKWVVLIHSIPSNRHAKLGTQYALCNATPTTLREV